MTKWARVLGFVGLAALVAAALAATALGQGQTVKAGNLVVFVDGGFRPQKLPKTTPAPISLQAETTLKTADGTHPPAAKTLSLEFDKHAGINTKGLPTCSVDRLQNTLTGQAESICGKALVGTGEAGAEIAFPEQPPFFAKGKMLVFNGRPKNGHQVLIFHVYARVPAPTTFVTTAVISEGERHLRDEDRNRDPDDRRRPGLADLRDAGNQERLDLQRQEGAPAARDLPDRAVLHQGRPEVRRRDRDAGQSAPQLQPDPGLSAASC